MSSFLRRCPVLCRTAAQLIANQRASRYPVPPIKRPSFLVDKHTGGVGGIICMQQLPSSRHDAQPRAAKADKVFPRDSLQVRLGARKRLPLAGRGWPHPPVALREVRNCPHNQVLTTPRRPTNYFTLPSLNLKHVKSNTSARSRGGSQTAREGADLQSAEKGSRTGAQTARERAKVALAAESIVNSLKKRLRSGLVTANSQQGARLGMTAEHTSLTTGSQAMRGDETAHGEIARDRSTMQLQMQLQA